MDLTLERWNAFTDAERQAASANLPLPPEVEPRGFLGRVAQFSWRGQLFSLVPGGSVALGFDADQWEPNPDETTRRAIGTRPTSAPPRPSGSVSGCSRRASSSDRRKASCPIGT